MEQPRDRFHQQYFQKVLDLLIHPKIFENNIQAFAVEYIWLNKIGQVVYILQDNAPPLHGRKKISSNEFSASK